MYLIPQITSNALQQQTLVLPSGDTFFLKMYFRPMQYGWFISELTWSTFAIRELRITNSMNMLHQFKNKIPFGLACISQANREPSQQTDFSSGVSKLYVLDADEVSYWASVLRNG
jgi:hypothetical protein